MRKLTILLLAVLFCSLSAWSEPLLVELGLDLLKHYDKVSKIEEILEKNGLNVTSKDFDKYVACAYSLTAENSDTIPELQAEFVNNCTNKIAGVVFKISLNSDYYNDLSSQLNNFGFELIEDDGNELIYRNSKNIQCNISFPKYGRANIMIIGRTYQIW